MNGFSRLPTLPKNWMCTASWLMLLATSYIPVGCEPGTRRIQFREELQLQDGQRLLADRDLTIKVLGGEIGGLGGWEPLYESLEVIGPQHSDLPPKWSSSDGLIPVLLDRAPDTGQWTLIASFIMCDPWVKYAGPRLLTLSSKCATAIGSELIYRPPGSAAGSMYLRQSARAASLRC